MANTAFTVGQPPFNISDDTTPQLGGDLDTNGNDIDIGSDDGLTLTVAPTSDHNASGTKGTFTAGESLVFGSVCYIKSDGKAWKADADGSAPAERGLLISLATISADAAGVFALPGTVIRDDTWTWTVGNPVYLSATAGALTQTAPSTALVMGIATHADRMFFYPTIQDAGGGGGGTITTYFLGGGGGYTLSLSENRMEPADPNPRAWMNTSGKNASTQFRLPSAASGIDSATVRLYSADIVEPTMNFRAISTAENELYTAGTKSSDLNNTTYYSSASAVNEWIDYDVTSLFSAAVGGDQCALSLELQATGGPIAVGTLEIEWS